MAFAVIETGGKQYRISPGSVVTVEKLDTAEGESVTFDKVLMYVLDGAPVTGAPYVEGVTVTAKVVSQHRGPKIRVFTYKAKKRQRRTIGHRQSQTQLRIGDIVTATAAPKKEKAVAAKKASTKTEE